MRRVNLIALLLLVVVTVYADVYLHNPPGSNNRLNGKNREVGNNNQNRLFDSQNNQRGGYNVGGDGETEGGSTLTYVGGSELSIQWTNQHECGGGNTGCDIVLQYLCNDGVRDGVTLTKIGEGNDNTRRGRHEDQQYYADCKGRARDTNLYHADQKLNRNDATSTRQNPGGKRSGLECPEERDYYPYHSPSPWKDIAVLTSNSDNCKDIKAESQNVKTKGYCKNANGLNPITQTACKAAGGTWNISPSHDLPEPDCQEAPKSRDNQLGNTESSGPNDARIPKTLAYKWNVPNINAEACVLRIRYNMTVGDYAPFQVNAANDNTRGNRGTPNLDIGSEYGLNNPDDAKNRGYIMKNNPRIKPLSDTSRLDFQLAINTAQTGRTFEDRTHKFRITKKENVPSIPAAAPVHNLNVIGKRGNIVQVFPAVEYGFEPAILNVAKGAIVHPQWTGSLNNPQNNDGEGRRGEDKSNMIAMTPRNYEPNQLANTVGHPGNSYPLKITEGTFLGVGADTAKKLAFPLPGTSANIAVGRTVGQVQAAETVCEGRTMTINCPASTTMKVWSANYGRLNRDVCKHRAMRDVACTAASSLGKVAAACDGKSSCSVRASNGVFGDPCGGTYKYLDVNYECIGAAATAAGSTGVTLQPAPAPAQTVAYLMNWRINCWRRCGYKGGACPTRCGAGGSCCRRGWNDCSDTLQAVAPTRYHSCVGTRTTGRKDEPVQDESTAQETAPVAHPENSEKDTNEDWSFTRTVNAVESDIKESDEQINDILGSFDEEVLMDNEEGAIEKRGGRRRRGNAAKLDAAPPYVNMGPIQADTCGTYNYLSTRNNNFSNRSQKGKIVVC